MLRATNLSKTFLEGERPLTVLRGLELELRGGELVSVVGRSGSGKSTLLSMLGLLDRPDAGEVELEGRVTSSLPDVERARLRGSFVGFVFQAFHLVPRWTVLQNVLLPALFTAQGAGRALEARARTLLDQVGLGDAASRNPTFLSGGERQRVALARALLRDPPTLLCDEPTGNLDTETAAEIIALLRRRADEGRAVLCVTHEAALARSSDRTLRLVDGVLALSGEDP